MLTGSFGTVTNDEDWIVEIETTDEDTGAGYDLSGHLIEVRVSDNRNASVLTGSTTDGKVVVSPDGEGVDSIITWTFRAAAMRSICAGSYNVAARISDGTETRQIINGKLAIVEGHFT